MTDGVVGPPISSGPDDGWGVSPDPSVSVIRPRIGPLCTLHFRPFFIYSASNKHTIRRNRIIISYIDDTPITHNPVYVRRVDLST
jgi:hypothetical protein